MPLQKIQFRPGLNREKEKETKRLWNLANPEKHRGYIKAWEEKNPEKIKAAQRKWYLANKDKVKAKTRARQAAKLQRTPSWLTPIHKERMETQYKLASLLSKITGHPWEVDHILPLQGENVSGFHVPYNLQVMPRTLNRSKHNRAES
jgi:hypothetical protein